jgi:alginate O-acetyltransferase complex protein AlgI
MLFTQPRFFGFLLAVFAVHWTLRSARGRKWWLLAASYVFYGCFDWRFLGLLWLSTLVNYGLGRAMEGRERPARKPFMVASVVSDLLLLGTFKYCAFFVDSAVELLLLLGFHPSRPTLSLALPVGISFYTFQTMSYAIDVYRGRMRPVRDLLDFALFAGFFPQIGAGPITRAVQIQPQLETPRSFARHVDARAALTLFFLGFVKKACIADGIVAYVDPVLAAPLEAGRAATWSALLLYHVQIYCDFSGYTDMAIATAWLLGYRLPKNFDFPYLASGIGDFWRRWHISLSTWMRDYVYFPLVGKNPSRGRRRAALVAALGLCGLWHGAGWQFLGFGLLHGVYLVIEDLWTGARGHEPRSRAGAALSCLGLNLVLLLTWPVFHTRTLADVRTLYGVLFSAGTPGEPFVGSGTILLVSVCALAHWLASRWNPLAVAALLPLWTYAILYGVAWALALPWVSVNLAPFIYFRF